MDTIIAIIVFFIVICGLTLLFLLCKKEEDKKREEDIKLKKELISKLDDIDTRLFNIALCYYVKRENRECRNATRIKTK